MSLLYLLILASSQYSLVAIFSVRYKQTVTGYLATGIWGEMGLQSLIMIYNFTIGLIVWLVTFFITLFQKKVNLKETVQ